MHIETRNGIRHAVRIDRYHNVPVYLVDTSDGQRLRASGAHRVAIHIETRIDECVWIPISSLRDRDLVDTRTGPAAITSVQPDGVDDVYMVYEPYTGTWITNGYISQAGIV